MKKFHQHSNHTFRSIVLLIFVLVQKFNAQSTYTFFSSPSFHNGFILKIDKEKNRAVFETKNNFYYLDKLENNNNERPSYENKFIKKNENLLSNSIFEKSLSVDAIDKLIKDINLFKDKCKKEPKNIGYDGIMFVASINRDSCQIQSPSQNSETGKVVLNLLDKIKETFHPNIIVDKYVFDSKLYFDQDRSFEILNKNPLFLKLYQFPLVMGCQSFEDQINELPNEKEVFIDITDFRRTEEKECLIEILKKKFKKITIIQNKEYDYFNE